MSKQIDNDDDDTTSYPLSKHANDGLSSYGGSRDVVGYANSPPVVSWPNGAKVALNLVLNYEEGGENCLLHGDNESEKLLSEIVGASAIANQRHANMESLYDYGSRAGYWRLYNLLTKRYNVPCTVFAVGMALERNPPVCASLRHAIEHCNWEVASHGYRWWDYQNVPMDVEREHIARSVQIHKELLGVRPVGMYQGKPNINTRQLVMEEGGFLYDSDAYSDDLPYWTLTQQQSQQRPHLIIPYTLSENDMRFAIPNGFSHGQEFSTYLKDSLAYLLEEGRNGSPKMMSVGLHCRLVGRPGRAKGLEEFLDYATSLGDEVWITTRAEIAKHWYKHHYPDMRDDVVGGGRSRL
jgi:allantoinase